MDQKRAEVQRRQQLGLGQLPCRQGCRATKRHREDATDTRPLRPVPVERKLAHLLIPAKKQRPEPLDCGVLYLNRANRP